MMARMVPDSDGVTQTVVDTGEHRFSIRHHGAADAVCRLLWLPALGVSARHYDEFGRELAARGVELAAMDYRGVGSSSLRGSRQHDWTYRTVVDVDLPAALASMGEGLPLAIGGHSIGGQFAVLHAAAHDRAQALALVATGVPHWRRYGWRAVPLLLLAGWVRLATTLHGYYPGRRYGFAGNEAGGLMANWTRTIMTGRYRFPDRDFESMLGGGGLPTVAIGMAQDLLVTRRSTRALLAKAGGGELVDLQAGDFNDARADHFGWLREPAPVAQVLAERLKPVLAPERLPAADAGA